MKTTGYSCLLLVFLTQALSAQTPTITCPPNITVDTSPATCSGAYGYVVDFSNGDLAQTSGLPSGDFPWGVTVNQFLVTDMMGNTASCSFSVTVRDRTKPGCTPPPDVVVSCTNFDPSLVAYGLPALEDNCCFDTLLVSANWAQFDTVCHRGAIIRSFEAVDCSGNSSLCSQQVQVTYEAAYYIRFPDDVIVTACPQGLNFGEPVLFGAECAQMDVSFEDEVNGLPVDGCFKFERIWTIIDGCAFDPALPVQYVPNPTPSAILFDPANLPGPTVSACDALAPWEPSIMQIRSIDTFSTNYCTFWDPTPNGYIYKQIVRIVDMTPAVISNCPPTSVTLVDTTMNDFTLWRNIFNPLLPEQDLTEITTDLNVRGSDDCTGGGILISWLLFLDLDQDGTQESVVNSKFLPAAGTVQYNNIGSAPNYQGGTPVSFDARFVPANQKWRFALQQTVTSTERTASLRWNTALAPNNFVVPQLPQGTHRIQWEVVDGCGNVTECEHTFTIQPGPPNLGPMINCPPNVTVSTFFQTCSGAYQYAVDASAGTLVQTAGLPSGNFPLGETVNRFVVTDSVGNTASCSFSVKVLDLAPPAVSCNQQTIVLIGIDDPTDCYESNGSDHLGGVSWVKAAAFDNGTTDNCGQVFFTVRRVPPYSNCILSLNTTNGQLPCNDVFPDFPSEFERAISENDSIKFYCCEVGSIVNVVFRAYQLNPDGSISVEPDGTPIYSDCEMAVKVEDRLKPSCVPPANVVVSCGDFDPNLMTYGMPAPLDNCCFDTITTIADLTQFDTVCQHGLITRTFQAFDCSGNSSTCSQLIRVDDAQDYYIHFPDDVILTQCSGQGYGEPTYLGSGCEMVQISYEDETIDVVPDACYRISRNWRVINWCHYNPNLPLINIPNPNPNAIINHPSNLPGPIVSSCDALAPWDATVVKIIPSDPVATNYCTFWDPNANGYQYNQTIKIVDLEDPIITNCSTGTVLLQDTTPNDPALWNNVFNPNLPAQDLTELETELSITASDACSGTNVGINYLLLLDLDGDGAQETVVNSTQLGGQPGGLGWNNILFGNIAGVGIPREFDSRPVPSNEKWGFAVQHTTDGFNRTAAIKFNTVQDPTTFLTPQLPQGTHKVRWFVTDGCGNESICEELFTIQQGPTSGVSTLENAGFVLSQNEPNPFQHSTTVSFRLPDAAAAVLTVYDTEGREVYRNNGAYGQGYNSLLLEGEWLKVPGVFYYKLESGSKVAWRKMVLIR